MICILLVMSRLSTSMSFQGFLILFSQVFRSSSLSSTCFSPSLAFRAFLLFAMVGVRAYEVVKYLRLLKLHFICVGDLLCGDLFACLGSVWGISPFDKPGLPLWSLVVSHLFSVQSRKRNSMRGNIVEVVVGKTSLFSVPDESMITRPAADESASMPGCSSTGSQSSRDEVMNTFRRSL